MAVQVRFASLPFIHIYKRNGLAVPSPSHVKVRVEVPLGSFLKRRPDGSLDFLSPFPWPFNYGSVPSVSAPDGDPLDAIVLGGYLPYGHVGTWEVKGMVKFTDAGFVDNKLICIQGIINERPNHKINPLQSVGKHEDPQSCIFGGNFCRQEDIPTTDLMSLIACFSLYSIFKNGLNTFRGKSGPTAFHGLELYS